MAEQELFKVCRVDNRSDNVYGCYHGYCDADNTCICHSDWWTHDTLVFFAENCSRPVFIYDLLLAVFLFTFSRCTYLLYQNVVRRGRGFGSKSAIIFEYFAILFMTIGVVSFWLSSGSNRYGIVIFSLGALCHTASLVFVSDLLLSAAIKIIKKNFDPLKRRLKYIFMLVNLLNMITQALIIFAHQMLLSSRISAQTSNQLQGIGFMFAAIAFVVSVVGGGETFSQLIEATSVERFNFTPQGSELMRALHLKLKLAWRGLILIALLNIALLSYAAFFALTNYCLPFCFVVVDILHYLSFPNAIFTILNIVGKPPATKNSKIYSAKASKTEKIDDDLFASSVLGLEE